MKKLFIILLMVFLFFQTVRVVAAPNESIQVVVAAVTNTAVTFGFGATSVLVVNDGATNSVFVTLATTVATITDQEIKAGESMSFSLYSRAPGLGIITSAGTSSVRIYAIEGTSISISGGSIGSVTNSGTFAVQEDGSALTALQLIDNIVSGTGANISQIGGVAPSLNTGLRDAGTQRITVATDDLVPISVASLPLPAGAATSANQQTDALTDTQLRATAVPVSNATLPLPSGAATSANQITINTSINSSLYNEDTIAVSNDTGAGILGIANVTLVSKAANGDYLFEALSQSGASLAVPVYDALVPNATRATKREDDAASSTEAGVAVLYIRDDVLASGAGVTADDDYVYPRVDNFGAGWSALTADDGARIPANSTAGLKVDLGVDNDVTVASLPLPTGASTETTLAAINTKLVTGTVIGDVNLGAVDNAVLDSIADGIAAEIPATADITIQLEDVDVAQANPLPVRLSDGTTFVDPIVDDTTTHTSGTTTASAISMVAVPTDAVVDVNDMGVPAMSLDRRQLIDADLDAGLLDANSPTTEVAVLTLVDGSAETDIVTTNMGASKAITINGTGEITQACLIVEGVSPFSEDGNIIFFKSDPSITANTADLTSAQAQLVTNVISLVAADYQDEFATAKMNCQSVTEPFAGITHVVYHQTGATTITNQDVLLHVQFRRDS